MPFRITANSAAAKPRDAAAARECALRLLDRRAHSEHELRAKLRQRQFPDAVIGELLRDFRRLKLVDDLAFSRLLVEQKQGGSSAAGRLKIMHELRRRGVPRELLPEVEAEFFAGEEAQEEELARATALLARKLAVRRPPAAVADPREAALAKRKLALSLLRFLAARGFPPAVARRALKQAAAS